MDNAHIRARVLNRPQLCEPGYAQVLIGALSDRIGVEALTTGGQTHDRQALKAAADGFGERGAKPYQQAGNKAGLKVSLIHAGAKKVDGNPFEPLPDSVRADLQSEIDGLYRLFVSTVARNRGLAESKVRGTEARLFTGQAAVSAGLADQVMLAHDVLGAFDAHLRGQRSAAGTASTASTPQPVRSINSIAARIYGT